MTAEQPKKRKVGALSAAEKAFISEQAGRMSPEQIGAHLGRRPDLVRKHVKKRGLTGVKSDNERKHRVKVGTALTSSKRYGRIKNELTNDELGFFEEEYVKLVAQFQGDVLATEETQIIDAIRLDVLKSRNMVGRKRAKEEVERLEKMTDDLLRTVDDASELDDDAREFLAAVQKQLVEARTAEQSTTREYASLQERHDALMKSLKSTRDQRVRDVQSGKETIFALLKSLQQEEVRAAEGRTMELVRMAGEAEYAHLGELHTYEDGSADRPILAPETVAGGEDAAESD